MINKCLGIVPPYQKTFLKSFKFFSSKITYSERPTGKEFYEGRLKLNCLRDNPGARKKKKRKGRGHSSGRGRKSGRGMKGQKAHSNNFPKTYIGGSIPIFRKIPKRGAAKKKKPLTFMSLDKIGVFIDMGRIEPKKPITMKVIRDCGLILTVRHGIKILRGRTYDNLSPDAFFHHKVYIEATDASEGAKKTVERFGGKLKLVWHSKAAFAAHMAPWRHEFLPRTNGIPQPKYWEKYGFGKDPFTKNEDEETTEKGEKVAEESFGTKVRKCEENGKNEEIRKILEEFTKPRRTEKARNKKFRMKKKKRYLPNQTKIMRIPADIKTDPLKLQLLKMRHQLKYEE